ncbi:hypothetical protein Tco_0004112 [Tanacetum coccineum]
MPNNSFDTFEIQGLTFEEVTVGALTTRQLRLPSYTSSLESILSSPSCFLFASISANSSATALEQISP